MSDKKVKVTKIIRKDGISYRPAGGIKTDTNPTKPSSTSQDGNKQPEKKIIKRADGSKLIVANGKIIKRIVPPSPTKPVESPLKAELEKSPEVIQRTISVTPITPDKDEPEDNSMEDSYTPISPEDEKVERIVRPRGSPISAPTNKKTATRSRGHSYRRFPVVKKYGQSYLPSSNVKRSSYREKRRCRSRSRSPIVHSHRGRSRSPSKRSARYKSPSYEKYRHERHTHKVRRSSSESSRSPRPHGERTISPDISDTNKEQLISLIQKQAEEMLAEQHNVPIDNENKRKLRKAMEGVLIKRGLIKDHDASKGVLSTILSDSSDEEDSKLKQLRLKYADDVTLQDKQSNQEPETSISNPLPDLQQPRSNLISLTDEKPSSSTKQPLSDVSNSDMDFSDNDESENLSPFPIDLHEKHIAVERIDSPDEKTKAVFPYDEHELIYKKLSEKLESTSSSDGVNSLIVEIENRIKSFIELNLEPSVLEQKVKKYQMLVAKMVIKAETIKEEEAAAVKHDKKDEAPALREQIDYTAEPQIQDSLAAPEAPVNNELSEKEKLNQQYVSSRPGYHVCLLCMQEFNSQNQFMSHVNSKKHDDALNLKIKKMNRPINRKKVKKVGMIIKCRICDVTCMGQKKYNDHVVHRSHAIITQAYLKIGRNIPEPEIIHDHDADVREQVEQIQESDTPAVGREFMSVRNIPDCDDNEMPVYYCSICKVNCTSELQVERHVRSKKHYLVYIKTTQPEINISTGARDYKRRRATTKKMLSTMKTIKQMERNIENNREKLETEYKWQDEKPKTVLTPDQVEKNMQLLKHVRAAPIKKPPPPNDVYREVNQTTPGYFQEQEPVTSNSNEPSHNQGTFQGTNKGNRFFSRNSGNYFANQPRFDKNDSTIAERPYHEKKAEGSSSVYDNMKSYGYTPNPRTEFERSRGVDHVNVEEKSSFQPESSENISRGKKQYSYSPQKHSYGVYDTTETAQQNVYSNVKYASTENTTWHFDEAGSYLQSKKVAASRIIETYKPPKNLQNSELLNRDQAPHYPSSSMIGTRSNRSVDENDIESFPHAMIPKPGYYESGIAATSMSTHGALPGSRGTPQITSYEDTATDLQHSAGTYSAVSRFSKATATYTQDQPSSFSKHSPLYLNPPPPFSSYPPHNTEPHAANVSGNYHPSKRMPQNLMTPSAGDQPVQMPKRSDPYAPFHTYNMNVRGPTPGVDNTAPRAPAHFAQNNMHSYVIPRR